MNRSKFLTILGGISILSSKAFAKSDTIEIHFLRHATLIIRVGGVAFLVDPMLSEKNAMDPVANSRNVIRIPMVDLPFTGSVLKKLLSEVDAIIVTHTHRDHWDAKAQELLDKKIPVICQPTDVDKLNGQGFINLIPVGQDAAFQGLKIYRTGGQHGTGEIGQRMGNVSGFIIEFQNKKIYIAGDTIWCSEVEEALKKHTPDVVVLNTGAAQFDQGDPITMTADDVITAIHTLPSAIMIAVHMETVNHCSLTRNDLRKALEENNVSGNCLIPVDGEKIRL